MPYIKKEQRERILKEFGHGTKYIVIDAINLSGELNYAITVLLNRWLERNGVNYTELNMLMGVLECAKLELYRRIAAPYEDEKIQQNGDVYPV
jgi:hypothetical protein